MANQGLSLSSILFLKAKVTLNIFEPIDTLHTSNQDQAIFKQDCVLFYPKILTLKRKLLAVLKVNSFF